MASFDSNAPKHSRPDFAARIDNRNVGRAIPRHIDGHTQAAHPDGL
jgi:hypothetical protein